MLKVKYLLEFLTSKTTFYLSSTYFLSRVRKNINAHKDERLGRNSHDIWAISWRVIYSSNLI